MEICIIKKLFLTVELEVTEETTQKQLEEMIKKEIKDHPDLDDWDETDWTCKERYEAYDTYSGLTMFEQ